MASCPQLTRVRTTVRVEPSQREEWHADDAGFQRGFARTKTEEIKPRKTRITRKKSKNGFDSFRDVRVFRGRILVGKLSHIEKVKPYRENWYFNLPWNLLAWCGTVSFWRFCSLTTYS